jgi:hypothetical protein
MQRKVILKRELMQLISRTRTSVTPKARPSQPKATGDLGALKSDGIVDEYYSRTIP